MSRLLFFMNTTSVLSSNSFMFILPYRKLIWIQNHMEVNNSLICTFHSLVINFILHHHLNIINFFSWINIMLLQTEHLKDKFFCFHSICFNFSEWYFQFWGWYYTIIGSGRWDCFWLWYMTSILFSILVNDTSRQVVEPY